MARRNKDRSDRNEAAQAADDAAEATAKRDELLARLAIARARIAGAAQMLDDAIAHYDDPDDDKKGVTRAELLEAIDEELGRAAMSVQAAQELHKDIDPEEGEDDDGDE